MKTMHFEARGTTYYFFSQPTKDKTPKTEAQEIKAAMNRVYSNGDGLYIPARQIKGAMMGAVSMAKLKIERSSKRANDLIGALVYPAPKEIPLMSNGKGQIALQDVEICERFVKVDMGKGRWNKVAYIEPGWKLSFDIVINDMLEPEFIEETVRMGGLLCGIGGRRFEPGGRYEVLECNLNH